MLKTVCKFAAALLAVTAFSSAHAMLITWNVKGVVTGGALDGQTLQASVTLDTTNLPFSSSSATEFSMWGPSVNGVPANNINTGSFSIGATTYVYGPAAHEYGDVLVSKNANGDGDDWYSFRAFSILADGTMLDFGIYVDESTDLNSTLFSAAGLGLNQPVNPLANGLYTQIYVGVDGAQHFFEITEFTQIVDGVVVSTNVTAAVPEPGSLALLGLSLFGLAAARKRKQA